MSPGSVSVGLSAVIVAVTREVPRVLTVRWPAGGRDGGTAGRGPDGRGDAEPPSASIDEALPYGALEPDVDPKLEPGLRRWVRGLSGLELGYVEQLYTFGDRFREPEELRGGPRLISVAYLALVREVPLAGPPEAGWRDLYDFLPWEDWRAGRPRALDREIAPLLRRWVSEARGDARRVRRDRADIAFGRGGAAWDMERVLERYEVLYEVGAVAEAGVDDAERRAATGAGTDRPWLVPGESPSLGRPLAHDHRRILATALGRLRGKLRYRPVVFELLPSEFTLSQLQRVVEALAGARLHKGNFRRLVDRAGLVEGTGHLMGTGGRPAELFRFRPEVLREHVAPGVGLPGQHR